MPPLDRSTLTVFADALARLDQGFSRLPEFEPGSDPEALRRVLTEVAARMEDNYPYFHPLYAGQMLKPPHPIARLAYALALWINPNNHALDGGRASSALERDAVAQLARMFGWEAHLGHLTGGGTMANLEALWMAGQLRPGAAVVASSQAHYTHSRISGVLGLPFQAVGCDRYGRMDLGELERVLERENIGTVVASMGTTALGSVDPLPALLRLRERFGFRLHADAAYGGYFTLAPNLAEPARAAFDRLSEVDSIVVDPHKHGLQPYGCGCVLFRDPTVQRHYRHDSPATYFSSAELHLGEISLECSRPGAAAVALWATQRLLPLDRGGAFAGMLGECRQAALELVRLLRSSDRFLAAVDPELDIVVWAIRGGSVAESSRLARETFARAAGRDLHLAMAELPCSIVDPDGVLGSDQPTVTCLRSVLMKPEHLAWLPQIWQRLVQAAEPAS